MSNELFFLLIGAGISLVSSITTILIQHFLTVRRDNQLRIEQQKKEERDAVRASLLEGVRDSLTPKGSDMEGLLERQEKMEKIKGTVRKLVQNVPLTPVEKEALYTAWEDFEIRDEISTLLFVEADLWELVMQIETKQL